MHFWQTFRESGESDSFTKEITDKDLVRERFLFCHNVIFTLPKNNS